MRACQMQRKATYLPIPKQKAQHYWKAKLYGIDKFVGRDGALVELAPFVRRVMGSTPALAAT